MLTCRTSAFLADIDPFQLEPHVQGHFHFGFGFGLQNRFIKNCIIHAKRKASRSMYAGRIARMTRIVCQSVNP